MKENIKKDKKLLFSLTILLAIAIGITAAYFQGQIGTGATTNVTVNAKTTDVLTFSKDNDISITATQANFGSGAGNRTGTTTAVASLRANSDSNSATQTYNLYLNIEHNNFVYTTAPTNTPELLLTITDPSGNPVTSITGLTYTTVNGVSGFDITTKKGLIQLASNYSITSSSSTTATNQSWNITVTFVNLNSDQQLNTGKTFSAQAVIQKNTITTTMLDTGTNVYNKLTTILNYGESNEYPLVAFKRADALPSGFTATTANTISLSGSNPPVYIWLGDEYYAVSKGDVTGNGTVDSSDYGIIDDCVYGRSTCAEAQQIMGDLNGNGELDSDDVSLIINCSNGYCSGYSFLATNADGASAFTSTYGSTATMGTVYFYSEADIIYLNANSSSMFRDFVNLTIIDDLNNFSTINVTNMKDMFYSSGIGNISALANWNVSSVTDMAGMFGYTAISNLTPLSNWDVSSVESMGQSPYYEGMFIGCGNITSLTGLANWNVSSVTSMNEMFAFTSINDLTPLANWNVSSVIDMSGMFDTCSSLTSIAGLDNWDTSSVMYMATMFRQTNISTISPLANWDVSSVTSMNYMFYNCTSLTSIVGLANWDTSSLTSMRVMFSNTVLTSLTGLENWDVSTVTDMGYMFRGCTNLTNASAINDWNIVNVTYVYNDNFSNGFYWMFSDANNVHPTFSKRAGTWSSGTFIPS